MSEPKFKIGQKVIVLQLLCNGVRQDLSGDVRKYLRDGRIEVYLNSTFLFLEEHRLVDFEEYWNEKNKIKKGS